MCIRDSGTVRAASNYNPLANVDDGSCTYTCPSLSVNKQGYSVYINNSIKLQTNLAATKFSPNTGSGGFPAAYKAYVTITDNAGVDIYSKVSPNSHGGFQASSQYTHYDFLSFNTMNTVVGVTTSITVSFSIETNITTANPVQCVVTKPPVTYTIGCTDTTATNHGSFNFTDNAQCEYTGCMDITQTNTGAIWASNYNASYTTADNTTCTYGGTTSSTFTVEDIDVQADPYSKLVLKHTFDGTGYTTANISNFRVLTPGSNTGYAGWDNNLVGGNWASGNAASWSSVIPTNPIAATDLTQSIAYSDPANTGTIDSTQAPNVVNKYGGAAAYLTHPLSTLHPQTNVLAHSPLTISYTIEYGGTGNGVNPMSVNHQQTFTGGCKHITSGVPTDYLNYDSTLDMHIPDSCILGVFGCTSPQAINFFPGANVDDGTCCYIVGCMDTSAINYNPSACAPDPIAFPVLSALECCTLTAPTNLMATSPYTTTSGIGFGWDDVCNVSQYDLYAKINSGAWWKVTSNLPNNQQAAVAAGSGVPSLSIGGIQVGDEVSFKVNAIVNDSSLGATSPTTVTGYSNIVSRTVQ